MIKMISFFLNYLLDESIIKSKFWIPVQRTFFYYNYVCDDDAAARMIWHE